MSVIHLKKKDVVKSKARGVDIEFDHEKLATILGSGENRRRDENVDAPEEEAEEEDEGNKDDFDWEEVVEEAAVEGESGSGEKFYDAEDKDEGSPQSSAQQKEQDASGVDPSSPTGRIPEAMMTKL
ncbi:hypothetical protein Dimus_027008 [Dionaea muscipula]